MAKPEPSREIPRTQSAIVLMMPDDIEQRVLHTVAVTQHLPPEKVTIDSTFQELNIDSLDGINILFALENEFDINIPDDAAENVRSIRQLAEGVKALVAQKTAAAPPTA